MSNDNKKSEDVKECDDEKLQKRRLDVNAEAIKSANDWEHVDLGDDSRKNKFLRLMGASKKEHHGKIIIGDKTPTHGRSKEETEKLSENLEEQYKQGLEMKLSGHVRKHVGLGFQDDDDDNEDDNNIVGGDDSDRRRPRRDSHKRERDSGNNDNHDGDRRKDIRDKNTNEDVDEKKKSKYDDKNRRKDSTEKRRDSDKESEGSDRKRKDSDQGEGTKEKKFGLFVRASDS